MATVYEQWKSGQRIDAATLTRALNNPVQALHKPHYMRATGMTNSWIGDQEQNIVWRTTDLRGGFTSRDKSTFTTDTAGIYWINIMVTATTPVASSAKTDKPTVLIAKVKSTSFWSSGLMLKAFTTSKVKGTYQTAKAAGLVYMGAGSSMVAVVQGEGGAWTKPRTSNPEAALAVFTAVMVIPDATAL